MFKIKQVEINGFWGQYQISTTFNDDVNIFVGGNGSGKTTFINILQAVITVDLDLLCNLQFSDVSLFLTEKSPKLRSRKIIVTKVIGDTNEYKSIKFQIGNNVYNIPYIGERELKYTNRITGRFHPQVYRDIKLIKDVFTELINVSYLSVNRDSILKKETFREPKRDEIASPIDSRMNELMTALTTYQLQLETEITKLSKSFQENVLRSMLFNESFDYVNINEKIKIDLRKLQLGLKQAYRGLGILDNKTSEIIEKHSEAISKAADSINNYVEDNEKSVYVNDVTPLTLLRRTNKIIDLSTELEDSKKKILKPINDYIKLLNDFHQKKDFGLQDSTKEVGLKIMNNDFEIPYTQLSSGEKQLIIILTEALLQKNEETLFIADEPELSLHIEWQRQILPAIIALNPRAQVLIATHSPEIVGKFIDKAFNMENIIHD